MTKIINNDKERYNLLLKRQIVVSRNGDSNWFEFWHNGNLKDKIAEYNPISHELIYEEGKRESRVIENMCKLITLSR